MDKLVENNVVQALGLSFRQFRIKADGFFYIVAASPVGPHLPVVDPLYADADPGRPAEDRGGGRFLCLPVVPPVQQFLPRLGAVAGADEDPHPPAGGLYFGAALPLNQFQPVGDAPDVQDPPVRRRARNPRIPPEPGPVFFYPGCLGGHEIVDVQPGGCGGGRKPESVPPMELWGDRWSFAGS